MGDPNNSRQSSTIFMALSTPAQKPLGPARITFLTGIKRVKEGTYLNYTDMKLAPIGELGLDFFI